MSLIDFHVHTFPDALAPRAMKSLSEAGNIVPCGDGTYASVRKMMQEQDVELCMLQPVATRADQVLGINRSAVEWNKTHSDAVSFGSLYPTMSAAEVKHEVEYLSRGGVKGVKLHPEYQCFYPDDPKLTALYEACRDFGLMILFHAGKDLAYPEVHGSPERFAQVAKIKNLKIILGHMGGFRMWDEVEAHLMGLEDVYFDTAYCLEMPDWQMKELILGHGAYKVLFGSDFPWQNPSDIQKKIVALGLGDNTNSMIFSKNARKLIG